MFLDKTEHIIYTKKSFVNMINTRRIKWVYEHFGLACAIKSGAIDLVALMAFAGYCLTLPLQFIWILFRGRSKENL